MMSLAVEEPPLLSLQIAVRNLDHRDLRSVLAIDAQTAAPWSAGALLDTASKGRGFGIVAVLSKKHVIGFLVGEALPKSVQILHVAVARQYQRRRVGRHLLSWVRDTISQTTRNVVGAEVRETNLGAQMFLKKCGFTAVELLRDYYDDTGEDGIRFERRADTTIESASLDC